MISVVIPIYNEEEIISLLHEAVSGSMNEIDDQWEVVYVNDGSKDSSLHLLRELQAQDPHVVVVELSRNWGHMGALHAGLQTARGDAVVLMDGDLQDPPEVVPKLVAAWREGAQVVTAVRRSRQESRKVLAILFPLFYRVLGPSPITRSRSMPAFSACSTARCSTPSMVCGRATATSRACAPGSDIAPPSSIMTVRTESAATASSAS